MAQSFRVIERRTSADDVFDYLFAQINSMKLLPGTRISEVEVAKQFDLSRQPVREAFIRLANCDLLLVTPQKATVVRRFSIEKIKRARFLRLALECEVLKRACRRPLGRHEARLERSIEAQEKAIRDQDPERFHSLDYEFHKALCSAAGCDFVFEAIADSKAQVDRLCMLSLTQPAAMEELIVDHRAILNAIKERDVDAVTNAITHHLSRLDDVVTAIRKSHADHFED